MKSSKKYFIFSSPYYLIIWLMISSKKFVNKSVLKIWQLVFLWCVKINFGKLPLKWCIFIHGFFFSTLLPSNSYQYYKMYSLWYLHHVFIILWGHNMFKRHMYFAFKNQYFNDKLVLFPTEVSFNTSEENQLAYFQNDFFSNFFGDIMSHIIS